MANVFVCGGTGFMGQKLVARLLERGHHVTAVARPGSGARLPNGVRVVTGDPLDATTYARAVDGAATFVHLVGVSKPNPFKGRQFRAIDLESVKQSVKAAEQAGIAHFVYVSVAQPAPVMKAYIEVRQACEAMIGTGKWTATFLRPWYVLGPGRRWPLVLVPLYKLGEALGSEGARRLGLVTLEQMVRTLVWSVENPGTRILDVPAIRNIGSKV